MKKLIAISLALIMVFSVAPTAFAAAYQDSIIKTQTVSSDSFSADEDAKVQTVSADKQIMTLASEPTYGNIGWTEQQITNFVNNPPSGLSAGESIKMFFAKIFVQFAVISGKLNLNSMKKSLLKTVAGWIEAILKKHQPEEPLEVYIESLAKSYFANRAETVTLKLNISVNAKTNAKYIKIDGMQYNLKKTGDETYEAVVSVSPKIGIQYLTITEVGFENGKTAKVSYTLAVDIMKAMPEIVVFKIDSSKATPEVSFKLSDPDGAFKQGYLVVTNSDGQEVLKENMYANTDQTFTLRMDDGKTYRFNFVATYDVDHDYFDSDDKMVVEKSIFSKDITFTRDFNFIGSSFALTSKVTDSEDLVLTFKNGYNSYYKVSTVVIGGVHYPVSGPDENGVYTAVIPKGNTKGEQTVTIDAVTLENDSQKLYSVNRKLAYIYLKNAPTIGDIDVQLSGGDVISVSANVTDNDGAIDSIFVIVRDSKGDIVKQVALGKDGTAEITLDKLDEYTVEVTATYDLGDHNVVTITETYGETVKRNVEITDISADVKTGYAKKGESIDVFFTIEDNSKADPDYILINDERLMLEKQADGTYKATVTAPVERPKNGTVTCEATAVYYGDVEVEVSCSFAFEVLRAEPTVANDHVDDTTAKPTLYFDLIDEDDAFVSGRVFVDETGKEYGFNKRDSLAIELDGIEENKEYHVWLEITYDLDNDKNDPTYQIVKKVKEYTIEIIKEYNFTISNFALLAVTNDTVTLEFASTNDSSYAVQTVTVGGREYSVESDGYDSNIYYVNIPTEDFARSRTELVLEKVVLENMKAFTEELSGLAPVLVFKTLPTAVIWGATVSGDKTSVTAFVNITDEDAAINESFVVLKRGEKIVAKAQATEDGTVELKLEDEAMLSAGEYSVDVIASFDAVDGLEHSEESICVLPRTVTVDKQAVVTDIKANTFYPEKGADVELTVTAKVNTAEDITAVEINENKYPADKLDENTYKVTVKASDNAGYEEYTVSKVYLGDEETTASASVSAYVDVLKSVPVISGGYVDTDSATPVLHFDFSDPDNAFVSGQIIVTGSDGSTKTYNLDDPEGAVEIALEDVTENVIYTVSASVTYDLDSDPDSVDNKHTETIAASQFELIRDYNFKISAFKLAAIDEENITLNFTSTNNSNYAVNKVVIGGNEYLVTANGDNYTVTVPVSVIGQEKTELKIEKVILANLKAFEGEELSGLDTVTVFKDHPQANVTNAVVSENLGQIDITYSITDADETVAHAYAVLKNGDKIVSETEIKADESTASLTCDGRFTAGRYTVEIIADYNCVDGASHEGETISAEAYNVSVISLAKVTSLKADKAYYEKGEEIVLTVTIDTNVDKEIEHIKLSVDDTLYTPVLQADGTYEVTTTALNAGPITYSIARIDFAGEMVETADSAFVAVEVLKAQPTLDANTIRIDDTQNPPTLSFEITDADDAFKSGRVIVKQGDTVVKEYTFDSITPVIALDGLEDSTAYTLDVEVTYDLDSDKNDNVNVHTEYLEKNNAFELVGEHEFEVLDYKLINMDTQTITLGFSVTNASEYPVTAVTINGKSYSAISTGTDGYTVKVPVADTNRVRTELKLTEVVLESLKPFTVEDKSVTVFLDAPTMEDEDFTSEAKGDTLVVTVKPTDNDNTITNLYVTLMSYTDMSVLQQTATKNADGTYTATFKPSRADAYAAFVYADYNRLDGIVYEQEQIYIGFYVEGIATTVAVTNIDAPRYVQKNETVNLTLTVDGNSSFDAVTAKINDETVKLTKRSDSAYAAQITAPSTYGKVTFKVTEMTFVNGETVNISDSAEAEIYVLKSAPTVGKYEFDDTLDIPTITIRIDDPDGALLDEEIALTIREVGGNYVREETIKANEEKVIKSEGLLHDGQRTGKFILTIDGLYDLDDDENNANTYNVKDVLGEKEIELLDYEVYLEDITIDSVNADSNEVTFTFTAYSKTKQDISEVLVGGTYYPITGPDENGIYTAVVPFTANGDKKITVTVEGVKLTNGKVISDYGDAHSFDIFLDKPTASVSGVTVAENGVSVNAQFSVSDTDNTVTKFYAVLKNADGEAVDRKEVTLTDTTAVLNAAISGTYTVEITADYERFDGASHVDETLAASEEFEIANIDILELKDITATTLYKGLEKVDILDITDGIPTGRALEDYYIKIEMEDLPAFYADVKEFTLGDDGKLTVVPYEIIFRQYDEDKNALSDLAFDISYKDADGEHRLLKSAKELFDKIAQDPYGKYTLTEDLDASDIPATDVPIVNSFFYGTLDGDGHKIVGLNSTMFSRVYNGTVKNLIIEDAHVQANANKRGIIANSTSFNVTIDNVHIINSSIEETTSNVIEKIGGFFGEIWETAKFTNCSAINIKVQSDTQAGGIAGYMTSDTLIENCYVTGTISATFNNPNLGARAGGLVGWIDSGTINKSYANVRIVVPNPINAGGLVGGMGGSTAAVIKNSFAVNTGSGRKVVGFDVTDSHRITNIWETNLDSATSSVNATDKVQTVDNPYDAAFFTDTLNFDPSVWNLGLVSSSRLPNLIKDPMPNDGDDYITLENVNDIANYSEVRDNNDYKADKELAYYNISKLAPFITIDELVDIANGLSHDKLTTEKIAAILAFDNSGKLTVGVQGSDAASLTKIKVLYESGKSDEFDVTYLRIMGDLIAEYEIKELGLKYQFDSYVVDLDDSLVNKAIDWAKSYDYSEDIASTTSEEESRLYVDYYNETLKSKIEDAVVNYLLTYTDYPVYFENPVIQKQIENSITENAVKKMLYAYNYYDKWYSIGLTSVSLSDLLFFKGTVFGDGITTKYLIDSLYNTTSANRDTKATYTYYTNVLQNVTGMTFIEFLEYTFRVLDGYSNYNDWFKDHFKGILHEQSSTSANSNKIDYRIWDLLSKSSVLGDRQRNILPILTAPQEDMYIVSLPSQIMIGSLLRYNEWINGAEDREEKMRERLKFIGTRLGNFYGTMANLIPDSPEILNKHLHFQYDSRFGFPQSAQVTEGTQDKGTTQDPVIKWVFEAVDQLAAANGSGAYANGTDVWWVCYCALDPSDYNFMVFGHETAHNQDGYYFYDGYGRRVGTGPESHADDNFGTNITDDSVMFNLFKEYAVTDDINSNFSYTRINTYEGIKDFYYDVFETKYAIDYMMGQAFLNLTPEEKAGVAVQVSHTPDNNSRTFGTTYSRITADKIAAMDLKTVEDLMKNNLAMHSVESVNNANAGGYGEDSLYNVYWYQPFNNEGAGDAYTFRRNAKELLGIGGYVDGFIAYMSGKSKTDLEALRSATKNPDITWEEYKLDRFKRVADKLDKIPYFDYEEIIEQFTQALKADAKTGKYSESTNAQKVIYGLVKRATNDFRDGDFFTAPEAVTEIRSAAELIEAMNKNPYGNYKLMDDIDFEGIAPAGGTYYVSNTFVGILDGANHTISGLQYPLCNSVAYAQFRDITIDAESYNFSASAYLAKTAKRSTVNGVKVPVAEMMLPYFASKNVCYEYGENSITVAEHKIDSVDAFVAIGSSADNLKKKYILTQDIDFSNYNATGTSVVMGTFAGSINGDGHTISGLKQASLFQNFQGTAENLVIKNFTNNRSGSSMVAAFAGESSNATFRNMYFDGIDLSGWQNTAPLSGYDKSSVMEQITVVNTKVMSSSYYASLLVARKSGGRISDCYIEGELNTNTTQHGGVVGELMDSAVAENTISNVKVIRRLNSDSRNLSGGFAGSLYNNAVIRNSISMGDMVAAPDGSSPLKFTASDASLINSKISNCYELKEATGVSSIRDGVTTIKEVKKDVTETESFWKDTLKFSEEIWDFSKVTETGHPQLIHNGLTNLQF